MDRTQKSTAYEFSFFMLVRHTEPQTLYFPALATPELSDTGQNQLDLWGCQLHKHWDFQLYKGENTFFQVFQRCEKHKD